MLVTGTCTLWWSAARPRSHRGARTDVLQRRVNGNDSWSDGRRIVESYTWCWQEPCKQAGSSLCWVWCSSQLWGVLPQVLWHQPLVCVHYVYRETFLVSLTPLPHHSWPVHVVLLLFMKNTTTGLSMHVGWLDKKNDSQSGSSITADICLWVLNYTPSDFIKTKCHKQTHCIFVLKNSV